MLPRQDRECDQHQCAVKWRIEVTRHTSHVTRHTSPHCCIEVTRHTSPHCCIEVTRHTSHVTPLLY